jgi:dTDP-4-amino-4,6-dideoxygalactose transaminase
MAAERLAIDGGVPVRTRPFGATHDSKNGVKYAMTVTSGSAAMHTCVRAINPDPGDEIIVTPWTSRVMRTARMARR